MDVVDGLRVVARAPTQSIGCMNCHSRMMEAADEIERLRAELAEAQEKALRFDLDSAGIERREQEATELVTLRAELAECRRDAERYRRLCSLVAWGELGVCRGHNDTDEFADDGDMLDAWLDSPEMIAEAQGIDAALAAKEE